MDIIVTWVGMFAAAVIGMSYAAAVDHTQVYDFGDNCVHTIHTKNTPWWDGTREVTETYEGEGC